MNCETCLVLECAPNPLWPTGFEKSEIYLHNPEKLQVKRSKIEAFLPDFYQFPLKSSKNASILLPGCRWILHFSKPVGQEGFGAHSKAMQVSQFMRTKFLCQKNLQNTPVNPFSYYYHCRSIWSNRHIVWKGKTMLQLFLTLWQILISLLNSIHSGFHTQKSEACSLVIPLLSKSIN